jgi:hypothetical protein
MTVSDMTTNTAAHDDGGAESLKGEVRSSEVEIVEDLRAMAEEDREVLLKLIRHLRHLRKPLE